ncbi:MAG: urease accessory protein UreD [Deltaproteobacteria bacterium]|nr:urease accessory protein UreD [Deltaproteobacteria bacterium]
MLSSAVLGSLATAQVVVRAGFDRSEVHRARAAGPLRLLTPRAAGRAAWVVTSSLGGGLVHGDNVACEIAIHPGATCVITTQSSTKAYRGTTSQQLRVRALGDATALIVPDPIVPYRDATFTQLTSIELDASASLALVDVVTAGRVAHGERWSATRFDSTLSISLDGTRRLVDRFVLDPEDGSLARRLGRFEAIGTVVICGPRVDLIATAQLAALAEIPVRRDDPVIIAGSPFATGAMFRIAGDRVHAVVETTRELLREVCRAVGEDPWSRKF